MNTGFFLVSVLVCSFGALLYGYVKGWQHASRTTRNVVGRALDAALKGGKA